MRGEARKKRGADRPLVEEVTVGVDDVRLRELSLDERDDMGEFVFSTVCAIGDSVHGRVPGEGEGGDGGADLSFNRTPLHPSSELPGGPVR